MLPKDAILVVEAIKLLDSALRSSYDEIWVVVAPREVTIERLRSRGMSQLEAEARIRHQRSEADFRSAADVVIENGGDREATRTQVRAAFEEACARARSSRGAGT
jgi:dephospho-CoA kinase